MNTKQQILASLLVLAASLACMFIERLVTEPIREALPDATSFPTSEDDSLQACLDRLDEVLETQPFAPIGSSVYEELGADFDLVIYEVQGDEIKNPIVLYVPSEYRKYQEDTASHRRIWDFYVAIIPPELRRIVREFVIFTDGSEGESSAWVRPSMGNEDQWQVGFDLLDSDYPLYLADALVHETAHLLTLNTSQIPYDEDHYYSYDGKQTTPACPQYVIDGGCSLPNSYINLFYQGFWKDIYKEWWNTEQEAQKADSPEDYWQALEQFYDLHSDLFLNSYAATNVEEDMAESFSFFVQNAGPTGNTIPEQKVAFYYGFPELVGYRQQIIEGLCSYLK